MKKIFIFSLILILFFSFACVSASNINNGTTVQNDILIGNIDDSNDVNDTVYDSDISSGTNENILGTSNNIDNDKISGSMANGSFIVLDAELDDWKGSVFTLQEDYKYYPNWDDDFKSGITIDKSLTIDGAGHSIDGSDVARAFNCKSTVTLKNINFKNFKSITLYGAGTISSCTFTNCGSINWKGTISGCEFTDCAVGDLIKVTDTIEDCTFQNCGSRYGNLISGCNYVINCKFDNCKCEDGVVYKVSTVKDCTFNGCSLYSIYWDNRYAPTQWTPYITGCKFNNETNDWYKFIYSYNQWDTGLSVNIPSDDITVEDIAINSVTMNQGASGVVMFYIDDVFQCNVSVKSLDFKNLENMDVGTHVVKFVYLGDKLFKPITVSKNVKIVKANRTISISNIKNIEGEITIDINIGFKSTGNCTLTIDNKTLTSVISNGQATFKSTELTPGKYNCTFYYSGDNNYYSSNLNSEIEIPLKDPNFKINIEDSYYGSNPSITITSNNLNATVFVTVKNMNYTRTLSNGKTVITINKDNLQVGNYPIAVVFNGDEEYLPQTINSTLSYTKIPVNIEITVVSDTYPKENKMSFKCDVDGKAEVLIDGEVYKTIYNIKANQVNTVTRTYLSAGSHYVTIHFTPTSPLYGEKYKSKSFIIPKAELPIRLTTSDVYDGNDVIVNIGPHYNLFSSSQKLIITLDNNVTKEVKLLQYDYQDINFGILPVGTHVIKAYLDSKNTNYEIFNKTYVLIVLNKIPTEITGTVKNITYGQVTKINLISNVTGRAIVNIDDDYNQTVILYANDTTSVSFSNVPAGKHIVTAIFTPTNKIYNQSSFKTEYFVSKRDVTVQFNVNDFYYGDTPVIGVKTNVKGKLTISIGNNVKTQTLTAGGNWNNISFDKLGVGNYTVSLSYNAGSNYNIFTGTANFKITKMKSVITLSTTYNIEGNAYISLNSVYGDNKLLYVTVTDENHNPLKNVVVLISINGKIIKQTTNDYGKIEINPSEYIPDIYSINFSLEDTKYDNSPANATINVSKANPKFSTGDWNKIVTYGAASYLSFNYLDSKMKGVTIVVNLNGEKSITVDSNGKVSLPLSGLIPKTYNVKIVFKGNSYYNEDVKTLKVTVKKATPKITAKSITFKKSVKTKKYSITLKNNLNKVMKNTKVTIKVNKKIYTAKTNSKGVATFKITKLTKKGTFKSVITYTGNKYYNKVTKTVNIKVK